MDVATILETYLKNDWDLEIPDYIGTTQELRHWVEGHWEGCEWIPGYWVFDLPIRKDEMDPKRLTFQILIENLPEHSIWVARGTYRIEHKVKITIYLKLIKYQEEYTMDLYREFWYALKDEINRILIKNKFNLPGITNLNLPAGWDDKTNIAVGRGTKTTKEPIIWQSEQIVTAVYYHTEILETE
jgi:hypothetical protein